MCCCRYVATKSHPDEDIIDALGRQYTEEQHADAIAMLEEFVVKKAAKTEDRVLKKKRLKSRTIPIGPRKTTNAIERTIIRGGKREFAQEGEGERMKFKKRKMDLEENKHALAVEQLRQQHQQQQQHHQEVMQMLTMLGRGNQEQL